jgi:hypothetical protein
VLVYFFFTKSLFRKRQAFVFLVLKVIHKVKTFEPLQLISSAKKKQNLSIIVSQSPNNRGMPHGRVVFKRGFNGFIFQE